MNKELGKERLVKGVENFANAVSDMRAEMSKTPEQQPDKETQMTAFQKKFPDAKYLEPVIRIPTQGKKHPEMEKQREELTEYVVGVFESQMIMGKLEFFLTGLPGDPYCKWSIPVNKPVGVPRFVAKHLEKGLGWREMKPLGRDNIPESFYDDDMMTPFSRFEYKKRGTFHSINSF